MRTGERLDDASALYGADLARHRAAYRFAAGHFERAIGREAAERLVLDLGCGTGYGAAYLAASGHRVVALDRATPAISARHHADSRGARFVRGDLERLPLTSCSVAAVTSFQVIEHFADPRPYLSEVARVLRPEGTALFSTPNRLESDGENPFHLREYTAEELAGVLSNHFERVEVRGIHALGPAADYHAARLRQVRRITRLDPLALRRRLPRSFVEWAFAWLSVVVRLGVRRSAALTEVGDGHYEIGPANATSLDLLAVVRGPARDGSRHS